MDIFLYGLIGAILVLPAVYFIWMHSFPLKRKDADALIILGYKCNDDLIHPLLKERLDTAIELVEKYHYKAIILSGGAVASSKTEAEIMCSYLLEQGIPEEKILLEAESRNTVFNIQNCKRIFMQYDFKTCLLVSNSFHIRRMKYITHAVELPASFYAKRNFQTVIKQLKPTMDEIRAFRLTLPWLDKLKDTKDNIIS
ncbi:hypothetical protein CIL05_00815 [Virgibacillus profundi]|uniref:DUF218 domain-containing protein n=1 Tax=Virgibacillus profundi TaxID=2024555 RepID=A0A2A2IJ94_9BACI|nr:YdcF family protein [Virgibacillus profundi]PAV31230.1 hypothetical protein CIL05_00815 [Virgibacillus profundi]PXY55415.1 YdcF family protein [Virgibacillus profundi]